MLSWSTGQIVAEVEHVSVHELRRLGRELWFANPVSRSNTNNRNRSATGESREIARTVGLGVRGQRPEKACFASSGWAGPRFLVHSLWPQYY